MALTHHKFMRWRVALSAMLSGCVLFLWIDSYSNARRLLLPIPLGEAPYGFLSRAGSLHFIEYDFWEHESRRDFIQFSVPFWTLAIASVAAVVLTVVRRKKDAHESDGDPDSGHTNKVTTK
jgi:hypothetical protein